MTWRAAEVRRSSLSSRAKNALLGSGLDTAGAVAAAGFKRIHMIPNVGRQTRREIFGWLLEQYVGAEFGVGYD